VNPTTGNVDDWGVAGYTPVAPADDPDALGGIGTAGVTIEMGSLYDTLAPGTTGVLCTLVCSDDCLMSVTGNAIRGNVVLETAEEAALGLTQATDIPIGGAGDCFPDTDPQYSVWVALGKPDCWCQPPNGSGYQCYGDADGVTSGFPFNYRIFAGDLSALIENWQKKAADATLDPCADFDHKSSGFPFNYQVFAGDLSILIENWQKKDAALTQDCGL